MSAVAQLADSRYKSSAGSLSTTPDLAYFKVGDQDILKIFSQPQANLMQGMCRFENGFEQLLPLFRGLVLLGKPGSLSFIYEMNQSRVFFTYAIAEQERVRLFFDRIIQLLQKEVKFRQILDKVIANNRRFQAEQSLLQAALHSAAWD